MLGGTDISIDTVPSVGDVAARLVFVNGRLRADLSDISELPEGVRFDTLENVLAEDPLWVEANMGSVAKDADQAMLALNDAMMGLRLCAACSKGQSADEAC